MPSRSVGEPHAFGAADKKDGPTARRLGELLSDLGFITPEQLSEAETLRRESGGFLARILVEKAYISEPKLMLTLVKECKVPHIRLTDYSIDEGVAELIPENVCLRHGMLPVDLLGSILTVAMVNPLDTDALETLRRAFPVLQIKPILCSWSDFYHTAQRLWPENPAFNHPEFDFTLLDLHPGRGGFGRVNAFGEVAIQPEREIPEVVVQETAARLAASESAMVLNGVDAVVRDVIGSALGELSDRIESLLGDGELPQGISTRQLLERVQATMIQALESHG